MACNQAIEGEASGKVAKAWPMTFRSTTFVLKIVPVENIRFEAIAYAAHVTWTALQKNQLVINEAQTSAKKTTAKFGEQVTCATPTSERIAAGFVDSAAECSTSGLAREC